MRASGRTSVEDLVSIGGESLALRPSVAPDMLAAYALGPELFCMLQLKNGFYAFESALHVFPAASTDVMTLEEWNSGPLWRGHYGDLAEGLLFFAEDVFQDQFCISEKGVLRFNAETGETTPLADSIEDWARIILRDYSQETGWSLAAKWQGLQGPLVPGKRLMPKTPFFLGGEYSLANVWAGDGVEGMRFKASLAVQTRGLPDGSAVRLQSRKEPWKQ
jgi:hypothetical protein